MPKNYILTIQAEDDLKEAKKWSLSRWGRDLTHRYFADLEEGAEYIAKNHKSLTKKNDVLSGLGIYPVREHYIVYKPLSENYIAIVSVIRQGRDIKSIIGKISWQIERQLKEIETNKNLKPF